MTTELKPCPWCAAGETAIHENKGVWGGKGYGNPVSVEVLHWCPAVDGQPSRMITRIGRDLESAIAAWNRRTEPAGSAEPSKPVIDAELIAEMDWCIENGHQGPRSHNLLKYLRAALTAPEQEQSAGSAGKVELPELPHTTYNGYSDGSEPLYTAEQMHDYARAVMSTQSTHQPDVSIKAGEIDMEKEREAFEKWVRESRPNVPLDRHPENPSRYDGVFAEWTWSAWQARAALAAPAQLSEENICNLVAAHEERDGLWNGPKFTHAGILSFARALLSAAQGKESE